MHFDDDDMKDAEGPKKVQTDFDCPNCNAHNPSGEPIEDGSELMCNYCGTEYVVKLLDSGKLKFRET